MGKSKKRRRSQSRDSLDDMRRRIRKLEQELESRRTHSKERHRSRSPRASSRWNKDRGRYDRDNRSVSDSPISSVADLREESPVSGNGITDPSTRCRDVDRAPTREPAIAVSDRSPRGSAQELEVSDDDNISILNENLPDELDSFLGGEPTTNGDFGTKVHETLAKRWAHIITSGLEKESEQELKNSYKIPENCTSLISPAMNTEITSILSSGQAGRDKYYIEMQTLLGKGLSALAYGISNIQENSENIQKTIKDQFLPQLCDAGRLFCLLFNSITASRRALVLPLLNKNLRETIGDAPPSEKLIFGADLNEKVKEAKNLENTAKELKNSFKLQVPQTAHRSGKGGGSHSRDQVSRSRPLNRYRPIHQPREVRSSRGRSSREFRREKNRGRKY